MELNPTTANNDLTDQSSLEEVAQKLHEQGLTKVDEFVELLKTCNLMSLRMVRQFPSTAKLVEQLFDMKTDIGKLQATGYYVAIAVCPHFSSVLKMHTPLNHL